MKVIPLLLDDNREAWQEEVEEVENHVSLELENFKSRIIYSVL